MKIVLRDWDLRNVGSVCMFNDDFELRRILRLMSGSVPEDLRSFCNSSVLDGSQGFKFGIRKGRFADL